MGCEVLSFLHYSGGHIIASYYNVHLFLSSTALNILYPITPVKGAAPLSGSIKDSAISWKTKSSKKGACVLFLALIFRYKTDIFQNKKKLHIDLKKKK